jgi:putative DNA primase/helicase
MGAKTFHVKSCFGFSGINPMLDHLADESRITVLELTRHDAEARDGFAAFVERITRTMTDDFAAGFVARSVWLMPEILDNAKTFSKAVAVHLGNSRVGDQIGTLLAGAFSEMSDKRVSFETALAWVKEQDWGDTTSVDALTDERRLLNLLVQGRITVDWGGSPPRREDLTIAEVVQIAAGSNGDTMAGAANKELRRRGLSVEDGGLWVSNTHTALKERLKDTPWSSQWARTLRRLPGTKPLDRKEPGIKFAGELARATFVPLDLII